jgi:hypothetical protein
MVTEYFKLPSFSATEKIILKVFQSCEEGPEIWYWLYIFYYIIAWRVVVDVKMKENSYKSHTA